MFIFCNVCPDGPKPYESVRFRASRRSSSAQTSSPGRRPHGAAASKGRRGRGAGGTRGGLQTATPKITAEKGKVPKRYMKEW